MQTEPPATAPAAAPGPAVPAPEVNLAAAPPDTQLFVNRELSLLQFQRRVFDEARDPTNPLLERVRFLSIVASNLDEFFMIRVAALRQQVAAGVTDRSSDGLTPAEQVAAIHREALDLGHAMVAYLHDELVPALRLAGIHVVDWPQLTEAQRTVANRWFQELAFPVLTPLAYDPGRPFPHISNLSLNLAVLVRDADGAERFARVKVPDSLPRLVPLGRSEDRPDGPARAEHFVWLEQLIAANATQLFPGMTVLEVHPFHVVRDGEMALQEADAGDLLESIEEGVRRRRFGSVVRLTVDGSIPAALRQLLAENLGVQGRDVYALEPPLALSRLSQLCGLDRPDLKFPSFVPALPARLVREGDEEGGDLFAAIRQHDVLLHHPFDSFTPVVDFLRAAAADPDVLAIKQTLYRVGRNSPVVEALLEAAEAGKQVAVLVELKARFDEESNIGWARALEAEGVHVIYGLLGLKTHSKIALVVRREGRTLRRYVHLSTGNYNAVTAGLYTDLGLFTCDPDIGDDATHLFNYLTGYSRWRDFRKLLVAPVNMRERLATLVERETAHARAGRGGHLIFKVNSLVDERMARLLVEASRAGVKVDLLVRGVCILRPGVPGGTENLNVRSVVGRFLEHSRVFWFANGGLEEVYLGSADLMSRNLDRRVEVLFPVLDPELVRHVRDDILGTYLADNQRARRMQPDGSYQRREPAAGEELVDAQARPLAIRAARRG
jgi:polyphosphate kinase